MIRIILFLLLIALAAAGAAWVADQTGDVVLTWGGWRVATSLPVFALALGVAIVAAMLAWSDPARAVAHAGTDPAPPARAASRARPPRHHPRAARDRPWRFRRRPRACRCRAPPCRATIRWRCCCTRNRRSSTATATARKRAFRAMAEREDTRLLGLRGLFIEAQRADDPVAAVMIAEEALKLAPASTWASHAVLGFRCAKGDWSGALAILDNNLASGPDRQGRPIGASAACC